MGFDRRTLDGLAVLQAVVAAGSFVRGGEALGLTQSAVSRAVARLEERVGVRIFRRTARSVSLTDEGRRFYEAVGPHLAAIEDATADAGRSSTKARGRLRVNVDAGIGQFVLTPHIQPFLAEHSDLTLEIAVRDRMGDLVAEGFDAAVRFGRPQPSTLRARQLMRARVLACASPAYIKRRGTPRHPREIEKDRHHSVDMRDPSTGSPFAWDFIRGKETIHVNTTAQLMVNQVGPLLAACLAGQGIAQILDLYAREFLADGRLVQVLPNWAEETYPLYAYHHSPLLMSAKVRVFLDFVVALTTAK